MIQILYKGNVDKAINNPSAAFRVYGQGCEYVPLYRIYEHSNHVEIRLVKEEFRAPGKEETKNHYGLQVKQIKYDGLGEIPSKGRVLATFWDWQVADNLKTAEDMLLNAWLRNNP